MNEAYLDKLNHPKIRFARNQWHTAAIHTDWVTRMYGTKGVLYQKAVEREKEASDAYSQLIDENVRTLPRD